MECSEARRLIDTGVQPGSATAQRAALGFHLASCAACRAYRARPGEHDLLAALLAEQTAPAAAPAAEGTTAILRPAPPRVRRRRPAPWWRYAVLGVLAVVALGMGLLAGRIARAAYTIGGNLAAMQITAAPTRPPGTPTIAIPTAPPATPADRKSVV